MKKLLLASLLALGLSAGYTYAENKATLELEHANKLATGDDSVDADMGDMKAQGKCSGSEKKLKNSASKCGASHKEKNAGKCAGDKSNPKKAQKTMKCGQGKCGGNN